MNVTDLARALFDINHEFGIEDCRHMCTWRDLTRPQQQQYVEMAEMLLGRFGLLDLAHRKEPGNASP